VVGETVNSELGHVSTDQLAAFVEGKLSLGEQVAVQEHLDSGCPECLSDLFFWRRALPALDALAWPAPPQSVRRKAVRAFHRRLEVPHVRGRRLGWTWLIPVVAAVTLAILLASPLPRTEVAFAAALEDVSGVVDIRLQPDSGWITITGLSSLPQGAEIRTGLDGQATLVFPDKNRVHLGGMTGLKLDGIRRAEGHWQIDLSQSRGSTGNLVRAGTSYYRIRTPAGEFATAGGQFNLEAGQDGLVELNVDQGTVAVTTSAGVVQMSAGQSASFSPAADTPLPTAAPTSTPAGLPQPTLPAPDGQPTDSTENQEGDGQNSNSGEQGQDATQSP
jgi:hypothetical protein